MSFSIFNLFLILFHSSLIEQTTGKTVPMTTEIILPTISGEVETMTFGRAETTEAGSTVRMITKETTDESSTYFTTTEAYKPDTTATATTGPTTSWKIDKSSTDSTVGTQFTPVIETRSNIPKHEEAREQELNTIKSEHSPMNVFGIVLASIASSVVLFYIFVTLLKKYTKKSYTVRSPGVELKQA